MLTPAHASNCVMDEWESFPEGSKMNLLLNRRVLVLLGAPGRHVREAGRVESVLSALFRISRWRLDKVKLQIMKLTLTIHIGDQD